MSSVYQPVTQGQSNGGPESDDDDDIIVIGKKRKNRDSNASENAGATLSAVSALPTTINARPAALAVHASVTGAFSGGGVASGATSDADGDVLTYRLGGIEGECAEEAWSVDSATGAVSANFAREDQAGRHYTLLSLIASDGLEESVVTARIRWTTEGGGRHAGRATRGFGSDASPASYDAPVGHAPFDRSMNAPV